MKTHIEIPSLDPLSAQVSGSIEASDHGKQYRERPSDDTHLAFLLDMAAEGHISLGLADAAKVIWQNARSATHGMMPIPAATVGSSGYVHYTWDRDVHHLEVEIPEPEPGKAEWFYTDWNSGETWAIDLPATSPAPPVLITLLRVICRADRKRQSVEVR